MCSLKNPFAAPASMSKTIATIRALLALVGVCFLGSDSLASPSRVTDEPAADVKTAEETSPLWQTRLEVQETDFIQFLSKDRVLVGTIDTNNMGGGLKPDQIMLLDSGNGRTIWSSPRDSYGSPQTILALDPAVVIQGSKQVAALDPDTGKVLWTLEKPAEKSYLLSAHGLIIFLSRSKAQPISLYAVNLKTGSEVWRTPLETYPNEKGVKIEVATTGDAVLVSGPQVAAFSASDGRLLWHMAFPGNVGSKSMAIPLGDDLYFTDGASISRSDPKSGKQMWSEAISEGTLEALTASAHRLYALGKKSGENPPDWIAALDPQTGKQFWKSDLPERAASPLSIEGRLIYLTTPGNVIAMDALNGSAVFRSAIPPDLQSEKLLPDNLRVERDRIIVARETGVLALQKADGKLLFADAVPGGMGFTYDYATNKLRHVVLTREPRHKNKKDQEASLNPDSAQPVENYRVAMADQRFVYESITQYQAAAAQNLLDMNRANFRPMVNPSPGGTQYTLRQQQQAAKAEFVTDAAAIGAVTVEAIVFAKEAERRMDSYQARVSQTVQTHGNSLQGNLYLRPTYQQHRGWSLHIVNLETAQRGDILLSSEDEVAPDTLAANLPAFSTDGSRIVSKGLGANPESAKRAWARKTLAGKVALVLPSVLAFDLASVRFEPCSKSATPTTQPAGAAKRKLDDQLIAAAFNSDIQAVRNSLNAGADVNAMDAYGKTALMLAAESLPSYAKLDIIKLLLKSGADPLVRDPSGLTALEHAVFLSGHAAPRVVDGINLLKKTEKNP